MATLDDTLLSEKKEAAPQKPPEQGVAASLGAWAHDHQKFFTSRSGELMFRNILRTIIGVIPTAIAFMSARHMFKAHESFLGNNPDSLIGKILNPALGKKYPLGRDVTYIFGGYVAFRAFSRMWQRTYDRIFAPAEDANTATQAIRDIPGNLWKDAKEILPAEIAGVAVAAFPLAAVKRGFINSETFPVTKGDFAMARKGFPNDWLASSAAYLPFFETADRIYDSVSGGKDSPDYYRKLKGLPAPEAIPPGKNKFAFFTDDGIGRLVFKRGVSLLLGIGMHMGGQRIAKATFGVPDMTQTGTKALITNTAKEYMSFFPFFGYTAVSDLYFQAYDGLFKKLNGRSEGRA